jgi:hypothetical protein
MHKFRSALLTFFILTGLLLPGMIFAQEDLTETFSLDGLSFSYPAGWLVEAEFGEVLLASSQEALDTVGSIDAFPAGEIGFSIINPASLREVGLSSTIDPVELVETILVMAEYESAVDIAEFPGVDFPSATTFVVEDGNTGQILAVDLGAGTAVMLIEFGGEPEDFAELIAAVVNTMTYTTGDVSDEEDGFRTDSVNVSVGAIHFSVPVDWVEETSPDDIVYLANNESALAALRQGDVPLIKESIGITVLPPAFLEEELDLASDLDHAEVLETLMLILSVSGEVVPYESDVPAVRAHVTGENVPGGKADLFVLAYPAGTIVVALQMGDLADADVAEDVVSRVRLESSDSTDGMIAYGDSVTGELTIDTPEDLYLFDGEAGDIVTITMIADDMDQLDTYLYLYTATDHAAGLPEIAENDDSGDATVGRFNSQILAFELPETTEYVIRATSYLGRGTGAYTLTLELESDEVTLVDGQLRQWAVSATGTSQYGEDSWSFMQATGEPDTFTCGDIPTAWASRSSTGDDVLALEYEHHVIPTQVNIYQTYTPGSIVRVDLSNTETSVVIELPDSADPPGNTPCPGVFTLNISEIDEPVNGVIIYLEQSIGGSWNEIDAVELVGIPLEGFEPDTP